MSQRDDLERYVALLKKWNAVQNLVSRETIGELWPRHIEDSLQLLDHVRESDRSVLDLGSGGGFPAIPLAIASRGVERRFTLVEPIAKKVSFLRTVARELDLPITVLPTRTAQIDSRETFDLITSRALAPLSDLLPMATRFLAPNGHMLLHKGRNYRDELAASTAHSQLNVVVHSSRTDTEGVILEITDLRDKSAA